MRAVKNLMMPVMHSVTLRILKYLMFVYTVCIFKTISPTYVAPPRKVRRLARTPRMTMRMSHCLSRQPRARAAARGSRD